MLCQAIKYNQIDVFSASTYQLYEIALINSYKNKHHRPQRLTLFPASPYQPQNVSIALVYISNATTENACQNGISES